MKRLQTLAACLVVLMLVGVVSLKSEQPGKIQGKAIVRSVNGTATYTVAGSSNPLKVNMELDPGTLITTGPNSYVFLSVNGVSSALRVQENTTVAIPTMSRIGSDREGDTETMLDLRVGSLLGQVKKVSANSTYEIKTPHGVAGIRGTDWGIVVVQLPDGRYMSTFTSVAGQVIVSAPVDGSIQTETLTDGQSWTPGDGPVRPTPLQYLNNCLNEISELVNGIFPPSFHGPGPFHPIFPVFPVGPPGQQPSSPHGPIPHPIHPGHPF